SRISPTVSARAPSGPSWQKRVTAGDLRSSLLARTQILARIRYNDAKLENDLGEQAPSMNVLQAKADGELDDGTAARAGSDQGAEGERSAVVSPRQSAWFGMSDADQTLAEGPFVGVVFNRPIEQVLTYRVPSRLKSVIRAGQRVRVPLGRGTKPAVGYVVRVDASAPADLDPARIKEVVEVLDPLPLIDGTMLQLTRWIADYYACSWGQALDAVVPAGVKKHAGTRIGTFLLVPAEIRADLREEILKRRLPPKQTAVLEVLCRSDEPLTVVDVCRMAKCTPVPIQALRKEGLVGSVKRRLPVGLSKTISPDDAPPALDDTDAPSQKGKTAKDLPRPVLTAEQAVTLDHLVPAIESGGFGPFLIHGVTGSGKTEVYLAAIEEVVARGREAIVMVPEISLTPQTIRRFRRRFASVAVLHSHMSDAERHRHWQSIASGEVQVVVGARSAVFAPARRLGLLVVDEEHESSFKQETTPRYNARDVAVMRAQMEGVPVLLGSATPSLESWRNAERGRYTRLAMPSRVGGRPMPRVEIIDMRNEKAAVAGLSESLRQAMVQALLEGGQIILLLNRRGFHTFVLCPRCGHVVKCHACDVAATYHKSRHTLICHTCDAERACPPACPGCGAPALHYGGIGTERLEREIRAAFPDVVARRMDSDTMRSPGSHEEVLGAFKAGLVRILLGTQMIAKGLDFPNVTLVGVVNADTALHLPDFRAAERTFQLVAQVAGRTGRGDRPGRVLVQTYAPDHPAIRSAAKHAFLEFAQNELPEREKFGVPPFGRLVRVIARGPEDKAVFAYMKDLAAAFRLAADPSVRVVGPAPAPIIKIRNLFRFHLQLRCANSRPLQNLVNMVPRNHPAQHGIELAIDVDPITML
ncbi:MAG TPA: primosomal protein N', partial [Isosphaeraceae bacterium]|nr:primosomal protein N' [Isosphaeraceae bacterium]